jgi:hypothetical protein
MQHLLDLIPHGLHPVRGGLKACVKRMLQPLAERSGTSGSSQSVISRLMIRLNPLPSSNNARVRQHEWMRLCFSMMRLPELDTRQAPGRL